jgi:hypothetical protein
MKQDSMTPQIAGADGISMQAPAVLLDGSAAQATSWTSSPIYVGNAQLYSLVLTCPSTGSPVGTVKLQACDDRARVASQMPDPRLTNFYDLVFYDASGNQVTSQAVSGASTIAFEETACAYRWVRVVYTATSGSITPTVSLQVKGTD